MIMTTKSVKKLKITVTNIKSILTDNTKKISNIKIARKRLDNNLLQLSKVEKKETNIENVKKSSPFSGFSKKVSSTFGNPIDAAINAAVILAGGTLLNALPPLVDKIKLAFEEVQKRFKQLSDITDKIGNFITAITDPIKKIFNIFIKPKSNNKTKLESEDNKDEIEGRVNGGDVEGGVPYVVGEREPEIFIPSENGTIFPSIAKLFDELPSVTSSENPIMPSISKSNLNTNRLNIIDKRPKRKKDKIVIVQRQVIEVNRGM